MDRPLAGRVSGFSEVDQCSDPMKYVRKLDETDIDPFWCQMKACTYRLMDAQAGSALLDVGCGAGSDVRTLGELVGPYGRVVGVDSSKVMLAEARLRNRDTNLPVEFRLGNAQRLDLPDQSFDACRAERVLQHVEDPKAALSEMVRVLRPGGRIVVVEPDHGMMYVGVADPALTRRILRSRCEHMHA
jgi:ubiquinone/menaquinone biosynthesis C-methylase UbiE